MRKAFTKTIRFDGHSVRFVSTDGATCRVAVDGQGYYRNTDGKNLPMWHDIDAYAIDKFAARYYISLIKGHSINPSTMRPYEAPQAKKERLARERMERLDREHQFLVRAWEMLVFPLRSSDAQKANLAFEIKNHLRDCDIILTEEGIEKRR